MCVAHGCLFLGCAFRLQVLCQRFRYLLDRAALESLLLCLAPPSGFPTLRTLCCRSQILTDMKKIAEECPLFAKHLATLQPDPLGPVSHSVNLAIQSPARLPCAVSQAMSHRFHLAEGRPIGRGGAVFGLRCHQPHFLPVAGTFALSLSWLHGSNHRSVRLRNHIFSPDLRQDAEGLRIPRLHLFAGSLGMLQSNPSHRAGPHGKAVMLLHPLRGLREGMLATKVRQDPFQATRMSARADSHSLG